MYFQTSSYSVSLKSDFYPFSLVSVAPDLTFPTFFQLIFWNMRFPSWPLVSILTHLYFLYLNILTTLDEGHI